MGLRAVGRRPSPGGGLRPGSSPARAVRPGRELAVGLRALGGGFWLAEGFRPGSGPTESWRGACELSGGGFCLAGAFGREAARRGADGGFAGPRAAAFVWRRAFGWEAASAGAGRLRQGAGGGACGPSGSGFCLAEAGELAIWCPCADSRRVGAERAAPRRRAGPSGTAIAAEGSGEPVGVGGASARCLPGGEPQLLPYRQRGAPGGGRTGPFSRCGCGEKRSPSPNRQNPGVCCRKMQHIRVFHRKNTENLRFIHK